MTVCQKASLRAKLKICWKGAGGKTHEQGHHRYICVRRQQYHILEQTRQRTLGPVSYTHLDVYKRQAQSILTDAYGGLVAADADIADHDGILNGWVLSPKAKSMLLTAVDGNKRPLFINNVADGAVPMILGAPVKQSKGCLLYTSRCV